MGIDRAYIRREFDRLTAPNSGAEAGISAYQPTANELLRNGISSQQAEQILERGTSSFRSRLIRTAFSHKEFLKRIPFLGKALVRYKDRLLREGLERAGMAMIDLSGCIGWYADDFIPECYRRLLGREPDPEGLAYYRGLARMGARNEVIAYAVACSPEFGHRAEILSLQEYRKVYRKFFRKQRILKIPLLGRLIALFLLPGRIMQLYGRMERSEAVICTATERLGEQLLRIQGAVDAQAELQRQIQSEERKHLETGIGGLRHFMRDGMSQAVQGLERYIDGGMSQAAQRLEELYERQTMGESSLQALKQLQEQDLSILTALSEKADWQAVITTGISEKTDQTGQKTELLLQKIDDTISASVAKIIMEYRRQDGVPANQTAEVRQSVPLASPGGESTYTRLDYFKFQNHFRGTRSLITERQKVYLPYFQNSRAPVLDIGCGRGEFLQLMKDNQIPAFGVDLYPEHSLEGELNGLDIRQGDGIAFLKSSNQQYGGIFSAQVIEHISFEALQEFCAIAYEKLLPGSYFVIETPNPTCLSTFAASFYIDPTHNKPVHPGLLEYLLKEVGFTEVQIVFTEASRAGSALPQIDSDVIKNLDELNAAIAKVSALLYGSMDYAAVAKK